jgi:hypothetical protein
MKKIKEGPSGPTLKQGAVRHVEKKKIIIKRANGLFFLFLQKRPGSCLLFYHFLENFTKGY